MCTTISAALKVRWTFREASLWVKVRVRVRAEGAVDFPGGPPPVARIALLFGAFPTGDLLARPLQLL